jgi:hypothetical protein
MAENFAEHSPPRYRQGTPALSRELYDDLSERVRGFPPFESVAVLKSRHLARLLQAEAPCRLLGKFPETPNLRDAEVVATGGDREVEIAAFSRLLELAFADDVDVEAAPGDAIPFYLSFRAAPMWSPLALADEQYALCLAGEPVALIPAIPVPRT